MKRYIRFSEDDGWNTAGNYKFRVSGGDHSFKTDDPQRAIVKWFQYQEQYPQDCAIFVTTKVDGVELLKAATPQFIEQLHSAYHCPYKLDYMLMSIQKNIENGCKYILENEYGDQVDPFSFG